MLEVALKHASAGLPVFPAAVFWNGRKWGKVPLIRWRIGASTNAETIEAWWHRSSDALPGLELGRVGLVVIDADRHHVDCDGVAAFSKLGPMPPHPIVRTAGNGEHHIFTGSLGNRRGALPAGVDVRGTGGWIVAPGAIRPDSARWAPVPGTPGLIEAFAAGTIPPVPQSIVELIGVQPVFVSAAAPMPRDVAESMTPSPSSMGGREHLYALAALRTSARELAALPDDGLGHDNILRRSLKMGSMIGRGWIDAETVTATFWSATIGSWTPLTASESRSIEQTIADGLRMGQEHPHPDLAPAPPRPTAKPGARANSILRKLAAEPSQIEWAAQVFGEMIFEGALRPAVAIELLKPYRGFDAGLARGFANAFRHWRRYER
jgi:Bifunctional DNA primase/polymerase, N-terminal